jgi:putative DNA methylase
VLVDRILEMDKNLPSRWRDAFRNARLLDPFAGFGSIPLEALRLGIGEVMAVELLPTAYVFLKAVLE